jgi:hypothetical protein
MIVRGLRSARRRGGALVAALVLVVADQELL